jgi:hypothetical protein
MFMKYIAITACMGLLFSACNNEAKKPEASVKTDKPLVAAASTTTAAPDSATMMKNWQEYATPGKAHELMKNVSGNWTGEITTWMAPGSAPIKSTGTEESKMIMGGRYQEAHFKGNFAGMPFEGMSLMGFDNKKKTYFSNWIDNMGTGIMNMEGSYDSVTKSITMLGTFIDPSTGKQCEAREVFRYLDNDHHFTEMFVKSEGGKEFKTMEISYFRKK